MPRALPLMPLMPLMRVMPLMPLMRLMPLLTIACQPAPAADQAPLARMEGWRHLFEPPVDPGIGVVTFAGVASAADTIPLFRGPGDARPTGYVIRISDTVAMAQTFALEWPDTLSGNLLEVDYEVPGLPADSAARPDGWIRVIPGFRPADSTPVYAWTRVGGASTEIVAWAERLGRHNLFFRDGVPPALSDAPEGRPVSFPLLPPDRGGYTLYPLDTRGAWMKVRAVTPSDFCAEPESPRAGEFWVRYLDQQGRPLVWYHTRGC